MKDTESNDIGSDARQNRVGKYSRKPARKDRGEVTIPGGAGAAGQIPVKGNDLKRKDDPLQPDVADEAD